jgi:CheY-like chemotaxis protein
MGGSLDVDSEVGVGTTFRLLVPLEATNAPQQSSRPGVEAIEPHCEQASDSPRVLIAEDHDINQSLIVAMAKRAGIRADLAENGEQAIAKVDEAALSGDPYLLVLMDVQMPVVDGIDATRRLRAAGHLPAILPIVALTANAYADDIAVCLAAGMQAHLAKPIRLRDLANIIDRWVKVPSMHRPATPNPASGRETSLTDQYLARKASALEAVGRLVRQGDCADKAVEDVASLLHKLAGSAGFFGDGALGEVAGALERSLMRASVEDRAELLVAGNAALRAAA